MHVQLDIRPRRSGRIQPLDCFLNGQKILREVSHRNRPEF
jgi:hypothetical protein